MPELAEARTISRKINNIKEIQSIKISNKFKTHLSKNLNIKIILNSKIIKIESYGKAILFFLEKDSKKFILLNKLGMSGNWFNHSNLVKNKNNVHLEFSNGKENIYYYDPRMFGSFSLYETHNLNIIKEENNWGIDLWTSTEKDILKEVLSTLKSEQVIKKKLLNQKLFAGVGNYLASEILFLAKINPKRKCSSLSEKELKLIIKSLKKVIKRALKYEGFSFAGGYFHPDGSKGKYDKHNFVYLKENCKSCLTKISTEYIDNRITYFCEKCQE